jgi:hypothetical protein
LKNKKMQQKLVITPKTKILDLITDYPELEKVLFDISPAFKQLKNPLLRRTVARVTTLQQAALVGGIKVEDLVNKLRLATGTQGIADSIPETHNYTSLQSTPAWFALDKVTRHLDAREMLNRGEHPVGQVLADLHDMPEDDIYELIAPFYPAPLIDKASGIGFSNYVVEVSPEQFRIYFVRT